MELIGQRTSQTIGGSAKRERRGQPCRRPRCQEIEQLGHLGIDRMQVSPAGAGRRDPAREHDRARPNRQDERHGPGSKDERDRREPERAPPQPSWEPVQAFANRPVCVGRRPRRRQPSTGPTTRRAGPGDDAHPGARGERRGGHGLDAHRTSRSLRIQANASTSSNTPRQSAARPAGVWNAPSICSRDVSHKNPKNPIGRIPRIAPESRA